MDNVKLDHFIQYISLVPVESLNKTHILDAFRKHFLRYEESKLIECDFGSNFSAAKTDLENQEENCVDEQDIKAVTETLKTQGVMVSQRSPLSPWLQGGIEKANMSIKKVMP